MKTSEIQKLYTEISGVKGKRLPVKVSFVLSRNLKKLEEVVSDIDEKRRELIEKYGEKDENGQIVSGENGSVKINNPEEFVKQMNEILDADVEITLDKMTEEDIEKCYQDGYDKLTVEETGALMEMVAG